MFIFSAIILLGTLGILWATLSSVTLGIALTLSLGQSVVFDLSPLLLATVIACTASFFIPSQIRFKTPLCGALIALFWLIFSAGSPLGIEFGVLAILCALFTGLCTFWLTSICIEGIPLSSMNRLQYERVLINVLRYTGMLFFAAIVIFPFYTMVMTSLKKQSDLLANPLDYSIDLAQSFSSLFSSYIELFTQYNFGQYILISAIVSVLTVIITLAASIPGAYAVSRLQFPGRTIFSRSVLLIYMVPAIVLVIPLYAVFSQLGLRNTLTGLLIVYPATTIPVALYMLQGYFRGLPAELEEAGMMDGSSRLGVIWRITLPLSLPAIASVSLYVFMIAWNEFLFAFMFLDDPSIYTLSRGVVSLNSSEVPRQHLMAGAVIVTVPVLFIFLWFEKFLVAGLTAGSVKG